MVMTAHLYLDADILNLIFLPKMGKKTENPFSGSVPKQS